MNFTSKWKTNNNCDVLAPPAYITSIDRQNAFTYAYNKLLFEKTNAYAAKNPNTIVWSPAFSDGSVNYPCPEGLTCHQGFPKIATKQECLARSHYDVNTIPSAGNWYLEWNKDKGDCYMGNYFYRQGCDTNFASTTGAERGQGDLLWDHENNICLMTQKYCQDYLNDDYDSGPGPNGSGGTCNLSGGKTVEEALFGKTATAFFSGNC